MTLRLQTNDFPNYDIVFFDLDGTFHIGGVPFPGLPELLSRVAQRSGTKFIAVTNNTSVVPDVHFQKLVRMGLDAEAFELCSPLNVIKSSLGVLLPKKIYAVCSASVAEYLTQAGYSLSSDRADAVLVTFDMELHYSKLVKASRLLQSGVPLHSTHIDVRCPTTDGYIPDCGAITTMLEVSSGVKCVGNFGKPSNAMACHLLQGYCQHRERALMIGDRLYTDIPLGVEMGIDTALVLTGEATAEDLKSPNAPTPSMVFRSFEDMLLSAHCR